MEYQEGDSGISGVGWWNPEGKLVESQVWGCSRVESHRLVVQS